MDDATASAGMQRHDTKKVFDFDLSPDQIDQLQAITGVRLAKLVVEAEPFEDVPLGTTVLGKIYVDPRTRVTARVNARFAE
jgi:hypothetical protein